MQHLCLHQTDACVSLWQNGGISHGATLASLTLMEQSVVAKLAKLSPTKQPWRQQQQGQFMTQAAQHHAILPAVTFEQTAFLFADVLLDPLLDQRLGGAALQGSRTRQVVRQPGPHLVHHLRLHFHLLHPASAGEGYRERTCLWRLKSMFRRERSLCSQRRFCWLTLSTASVMSQLSHSGGSCWNLTQASFLLPAGQRAARGATSGSIDGCNFTCWACSKPETWTFCYFKQPLVSSLWNHINLRSSRENELYMLSKPELHFLRVVMDRITCHLFSFTNFYLNI